MSVHNGLPFVREAVDSILRQSFTEFEFLILDDASTDGTLDYLNGIRDPRVRILPLEENIGLTAALNRGLREAKGEFVARQDADDISDSGRFERQIAFLRSHPRCALVGAQAHLIDHRGSSLGKKNFPLGHHAIRFAHLFDNAFAHSATLFRRSAVEELGGYDEGWPSSQDFELWSRLGERFEVANLSQRLVKLRIREGSITQTHRRADLIRRVQAAHYERLFGQRASEADLDLIALYRTRVVPERLREFRALVAEMLGCYAMRNQGVCTTKDFRRMRALLHERVGYNLLTVSRACAYGELLCALKLWPQLALHLPWLRVIALTCLGDGARRVYGRLAG